MHLAFSSHSLVHTAQRELGSTYPSIIHACTPQPCCRLSRVQETLKDMEASGMRPGVREYTSLLGACKRAAQPALATHVMYHTLPEAGLAADTQAWNALLGAHGRNGDMDNAYATWQVRTHTCMVENSRSMLLCTRTEGPSESTVPKPLLL